MKIINFQNGNLEIKVSEEKIFESCNRIYMACVTRKLEQLLLHRLCIISDMNIQNITIVSKHVTLQLNYNYILLKAHKNYIFLRWMEKYLDYCRISFKEVRISHSVVDNFILKIESLDSNDEIFNFSPKDIFLLLVICNFDNCVDIKERLSISIDIKEALKKYVA